MSLILDFFDCNKKCPEEISNCNELRNNFLKEKGNLKDFHCTGCEEATLKSKYIDIILSNKKPVELAIK